MRPVAAGATVAVMVKPAADRVRAPKPDGDWHRRRHPRRIAHLAGVGLALAAGIWLHGSAAAEALPPVGSTTLFVVDGHVALTPLDRKTGKTVPAQQTIVAAGEKATTTGDGSVIHSAMLPAEKALLERRLKRHGAQTPGEEAQIAALLAQFPGGGPGLRAAVAGAVEADPSLAAGLVAAAGQADPAVQRAIGAGLADAAAFFGKLGAPWARASAGLIEAAIAPAPPGLLAGFAAADGPGLGPPFPPGTAAAPTTNNCVSRSRPGNRC